MLVPRDPLPKDKPALPLVEDIAVHPADIVRTVEPVPENPSETTIEAVRPSFEPVVEPNLEPLDEAAPDTESADRDGAVQRFNSDPADESDRFVPLAPAS